jgi:hypothetical protein
MEARPARIAQQTKQWVYNIAYARGVCYIGETSKPLEECNN